ncbi:MAG: hypothetical protein ACLFOZ_19395 [Cyclobacteriaceae bacterium]
MDRIAGKNVLITLPVVDTETEVKQVVEAILLHPAGLEVEVVKFLSLLLCH